MRTIALLAVLALAPLAVAEDAPYTFNPTGKRDPFAAPPEARVLLPSACGTRAKAVQRVAIDALSVRAVFTGRSDPFAVLNGPAGEGYRVKIGDFVGTSCARVVRIGADGLALQELFATADGRVAHHDLALPFAPPAAAPVRPALEE